MTTKVCCCDAMTRAVSQRCDVHADPFDCADALIYYAPDAEQYGIIIHDGGSSFSVIAYCPGAARSCRSRSGMSVEVN